MSFLYKPIYYEMDFKPNIDPAVCFWLQYR